MPTNEMIKTMITEYEKERANLEIEFTGLRAGYEAHIQQGQALEKQLNELGMKIRDKSNIIDEFRKKFKIPIPKKKLPSVKRPPIKHRRKK